jgi:hypothetical protein
MPWAVDGESRSWLPSFNGGFATHARSTWCEAAKGGRKEGRGVVEVGRVIHLSDGDLRPARLEEECPRGLTTGLARDRIIGKKPLADAKIIRMGPVMGLAGTSE